MLQIGPCERHPVQEHLDLGVRLRPDRLDLALVAVAAGLGFEERPERGDAALPQHSAKLIGVGALIGAHWRWPGQAGGGPGWVPAGQTVDETAGRAWAVLGGASVTRMPPPSFPIML